MSVGPNINVWTLGKGARGQWKLQLSTADFEEAVTLFAELDGQGKQVALYELGLFEHEGQQVAGQIGFWWSANLNEYMEREPEDRGFGWSDDSDTYVHYRFREHSTAQAASTAVAVSTIPAPAEEASERYAEQPCDHCGKILPMNKLSRYTHEVQSGRTSGTTRTSRSNTSRASSGSFSNSTRNGSSSTSGRIYYRNETLLLCEDCYPVQVQRGRTFLQFILASLSRL